MKKWNSLSTTRLVARVSGNVMVIGLIMSALLLVAGHLNVPFDFRFGVMVGVGAFLLGMAAADIVFYTRKLQRERLLDDAERRAFGHNAFFARYYPDDDNDRVKSADTLEFVTRENVAEHVNSVLKEQLGNDSLANLYVQQIKVYQDESTSRARWSFAFAVVSMVLGFACVAAGGWYVLSSNELAAGATVAGIGGAMASFLSATFLRVYRMSIEQLHVYFQQPVVNDHIVTAQRIAEKMEAGEKRDALYEAIIKSVMTRVEATALPPKSS